MSAMEAESSDSSPKQVSESDETIEIEFDGNTVLCRVCGDRASGFHYGVHACEGCKGFFRRSIQQKIQYRPCLKNQLCLITRVNRNRCQYCRLKKCIAVGMSRDAVRFGRVPKREKAKIMEQMQKVNIQCHGSMLEAILANETELRRQIVDAHMKTCEFTKTDFDRFYQRAWSQPEVVSCPSHMACPLNPFPDAHVDAHKWDRFTDCFMPAIRNVVSFAKCIPGFSVLSQEDQVTLLKAGTFEVLLVHLACLFDSKNNTMLFMNGKIFRRTSMSFSTGAGYLLDSVFDFAERFNELNLTDDEIALFSALVIISSDRPGLRGADLVEKLQASITRSLQLQMKANHRDDQSVFAKLLVKVSELRMLNTVHSEKLLGLSVPPNEGLPDGYRANTVCPESRTSHLCYGTGGRDLDQKPSDMSFNFKNTFKSEDCGIRPEAVCLRGETDGFSSGPSRWSGGRALAKEEGDQSRGGICKPKVACEDYDGRIMRNSMPCKGVAEGGWVSNEVANSVHTTTATNHDAALSSTSSSSLTAHLSGSSIVTHQVMMKTVQQELILTTPVGTFHRMPLNLWTSAAATGGGESLVSTHGQKEGVTRMEVDDENDEENLLPERQSWKMVDEDDGDDGANDSVNVGITVIPKKNKVMRTWSEDTSSSKLSCSSCCSDGTANLEVLPARPSRSSRDQLEEPAPRRTLQFQSATRDKVECSSSIDLPYQKTTLSTGPLCSENAMNKLRVGNVLGRGAMNSKGFSDNELQPHFFSSGDQFPGRPEVASLGSSYLSPGDRVSAELFRNSFSSSVKIPVKDLNVGTDGEGLPRSSRPSSSFTAENILRPYDHSAKNKPQRIDRPMHSTTKATLKERLLKRIDSKDNINTADSKGNSGGGQRGPFGAEPAIPVMDAVGAAAFPLQFLNNYSHFYPLGFPAGIHPSILYNHLALQHLHSLQQEQQLQVQVQRDRAAQHARMPRMVDDGGTLNASELPLAQSVSSEHLSLDGSSECEDIKHLKPQTEYLSHQSSFLLKSETA